MFSAPVLRFALIWLLALCLPAQMALAQWRACCWQLSQAAEQGMPTHHAAGEHHNHSLADGAEAEPDEPGAHHHASACASCCAGAFWSAVAQWHPPPLRAARVLAPPEVVLPSPALPGLERPPRPLA